MLGQAGFRHVVEAMHTRILDMAGDFTARSQFTRPVASTRSASGRWRSSAVWAAAE